MYETIQYETKNNVAWIRLNRPEKFNAFTEQMNTEITRALKEANKDKEVRCLVITGNGRAFCSGEDLAGVKQDTDHAEILRKRYNPMVKQLSRVEKPIIAAVNGVAAGAGMSLALACDFRILSEKASFIEAFINVGLVPDSGNLFYLPRLVGHAKALELAIMGDKISADDAKELGLATKVVPLDQWEEEVGGFAEHLAQKPTKAIGLIKRYIQKSWECDLDEMLEYEAYAQRTAGQTHDHAEGVQAFMEKRKPEFKGH